MGNRTKLVATLLAMAVLGTGCAQKQQAQRAPRAGGKLTATTVPAGMPRGSGALAARKIPANATSIGEAITVTSPVKLADVRANPQSYFDKIVLVEATAAASCQAKGCWMTITDGAGEPVWVRWSTGCGGKYAFPKDVAGKTVLVQGSFHATEISAEDAEHLAKESGKLEAKAIAGKALEMSATACVVLPAGGPAPAPREG
ncbi:MAG: DUF4920 domain-containing protein [bacterium]